MREIEFSVTKENDGVKIHDFLKAFGVSSALLTHLKQTENGITVNGKFARAIDVLHSGDRLKIAIESRGHMPKPCAMDVEIAYEDEDLLVLNKPPGMPVHESRNHRGDTLSNFVAYHIKEDTAFRAVYRLDRDTSGLVVIAKNELAAAKLAGKVKKVYFAVAEGVIASPGTVKMPIARCGNSIIKRCVSPQGETAVTHYTPVRTKNGRTLLACRLETGRTHQIRVHMAYLGHPLLGDTLYGGSCTLIARQALHCGEVRFIHPVSLTEICLACDFPKDMKNLI